MSANPRTLGPYVILSRLGKGSAGAAYLARPYLGATGVPTPFVLKVLHASNNEESDFVERFLHEAKIAVRIDSSHVASVFDVGRFENSHYLAMEYVPGWTYSKIVHVVCTQEIEIPLAVIHRLLRDAATGLRALHEATDEFGAPLEAVHRDVSPKNLMVSDAGRGYVIDLGLAKSRVQEWQTAAGRIMGSPGYMAPEQIRARDIDCRADLYPLGAIGWELLTRRRWIPKTEPLKMLAEALSRRFEGPSKYRDGLTPQVDELFATALASDPAQRFESCQQWMGAMEAVLPAPATDAEVQDCLRRLIPKAYESRAREVMRLLSLPLPEPEKEDSTVVYMRRPGVEPEREPGPSRVTELRVVGAPLGPPPVAAVVVGTQAPPSGEGAGPLDAPGSSHAEAGRSELKSFSASFSFAGAEPRAVLVLLMIGVVIGVGVSLGVGTVLSGDSRTKPAPAASPAVGERPKVRPPPAASPAAVPGRPGVVARPLAPSPGVRPPPASPGPRAVVPRKASDTARAPTPAPSPRSSRRAAPESTQGRAAPVRAVEPEAAPETKPEAQVLADRLQAKVVKFKKGLPKGDQRRSAADMLLARLAMLKASGLGASAREQILRLQSEFEALRRTP